MDYLGSSLLFSSRENFDKVGKFSEDYGLGYYGDTDYGMRIMQAGLKSYVIPVKIIHHGGGSRKFLDKDFFVGMYAANCATFQKKWLPYLKIREK